MSLFHSQIIFKFISLILQVKGRFGDCYQFFPHKAAILCTRFKQVALGDICGSNVSGLVTLNKALNVSVTE